MAEATPRYLFRVWIDQSNGTNTPTCFKSAWRTWYDRGMYSNISVPKRFFSLKSKYQKALMGKDLKANPYVFTTESFLYALQHAISKTQGRHETNVHIMCIDTQTCKTTDGKNVRFYSAINTMIAFGMSMPRARWTYKERDYSDVWVTTSTIVPGRGSYHVSFTDLKQAGLYNLYPEYKAISNRPKPGLESPVRDLRRLWYCQNRDLPGNELNLAAQLANCFELVGGSVELDAQVPSHLLAWFIALKAQGPGGKKLRRWLNSHDSRRRNSVKGDGSPVFSMPEVVRYYKIYRVVQRHRIRVAEVIQANGDVPPYRIRQQLEHYVESKKQWRS